MANLITVRLQRGEGQPWGFRLQGGKDFSSPLVLQRVNGGSVADQAGLMPGDALVKVNSTEVFNLRHKDAQDVIVGAGNSFELTVSRGTAWRPSVTPTGSIPSPSPSLPGNITPVTKTSLAATPQPVQHIGSGHNQAAKPFAAAPGAQVNGSDGQIKSIVNKQYNTPVAMYSDETIAETLSSQAEVLAGGVLGVNFKKNERVYSPANSEVYKMLHEHGNDPEPASSHFYATQSHAIGGYATSGRLPVASLNKPRSPVPPQLGPRPVSAPMSVPAPAPAPAPMAAAPAPVPRPAPQTTPRAGIPPRIHHDGQKSGVQAISAALNAHATLNGRSQSPYVANNQNNITPKPFGTPMAQVQPPASYPPVAGSVPTPFSAAITGQAPAAAPVPAPYAAPVAAPAAQHASYPPAAAPAPVAPAVAAPTAAAPAAMPTPQGGENDDGDVEHQDQEEADEQKFGYEIPSQMEGMPVPSGRISMTDALITASERPYTPFSEVKFERSDMYQELLREQPSIQVDPEQNFSAFASVGGNRTPVPFKPIIPEIREEPCEEVSQPEPAPQPAEPEPVVEEEKPATLKPKEKTPPYPRKDAGSSHYSLAPNRDRSSPLHQPAEIPTYQRKWFNLPTQNPPHTPEPEELRQNVPLAFVDTHSKPHLAKPIAQSVNIRDQVTLKKTQPFTTIQNRTIPVIQTPLEDDAELSHFNNAHARLQSKGVIDRGQSFTPSLILTKHPTTIPYYQHQLGFEEYFAEVKEFDGRRTPQAVRKSPAFGPPPNPLKAYVPPSREGIPVESGLYLSMGKLHGVPWYSNKDHIPADIQQKMLQQQHGLGGGYDTVRQQRNVSYQEKPMTVQTEQRGNMTVQTRSQESAKREQTSSERTVSSASQVGNALIQKRTRIVEEEEHSQSASMVEISKFSSKIKDEEAPQKGYVAQQTRRFSGQDEALNVPPQLQQQQQQPLVAAPQPPVTQQPAEVQPQVTQTFPQQSSQPAPSSFPSVTLFPEPTMDRFPTKSARKASLMVSGARQSPTPTSTAAGFKAQFNEFLVGAGPLPPLEPQKEESTQELIQSWPPQLPSCMSNTNSCAGAQCSVKPSLPPVPAPTAPVVTNGRRSSTNSTTGFSNLLLSCSQNNNHSDRSGAGIGSNLVNKGRAACSTTAPTRGRGVMNKAVAPGGRIPLCGCCNQQIRGPFITALGRIWCPDHFICHNGNCKRPLADIGFVEEKGDLYCEYCFEEFLAPVCSKCNARVKGDCLNAIGKQFHPECFKCTYCGKLFGNSPFFLEEGDPYCETDWNELFTTKCFACGFPVEAGDKWVEALNNNYHSQCFNCTSCKKNLEGQSFFAKGGRPFCKNHAR